MRVRKFGPDGDATFGQSLANYDINSPAAVANAVNQRLNLVLGEWFLDQTDGTAWYTKVLGPRTQGTRDDIIRNRVLSTEGVRSILSFSASTDAVTRAYRVAMTIDTIYGAAELNLNTRPLGDTIYTSAPVLYTPPGTTPVTPPVVPITPPTVPVVPVIPPVIVPPTAVVLDLLETDTGKVLMTETNIPLIYVTGATSATALGIDTPGFIQPGYAITVRGAMSGISTSLDYNVGAGWLTAQSPVFNTAQGQYSFLIPAISAPGVYTIQVRDTSNQSVGATSGKFLVTTKTFASPTSGTLIFANDPSDHSQVISDSTDTNVLTLTNLLHPTTGGLAAVTFNNPLTYKRNVGADSKRRLPMPIGTKVSDTINDANGNFLTAGGLGNGNDDLILATDAALVTDQTMTIVYGAYIDTTGLYTYGTGPIWGALGPAGSLQYMTPVRWNGGTLNAQLFDASQVFTQAGTTQPTSGWYVICTTWNHNALQYMRDNVLKGGPTTIASTGAFHPNNFTWGGGFVTGATTNNTNAFPGVGAMAVYSGALNTSDAAKMSILVGHSIGKDLGMSTIEV